MRSHSVVLLPTLIAGFIFQIQAQSNSSDPQKNLPVLKTELSLATGIWDISTQRAGTLQVTVNPRTDALADPASH